MTPVGDSERLVLREFGVGDLDELAAMVADEDQMRFYEPARTRDDAFTWISRSLRFYDQHGFGPWLIELRSTAEFAGHCGIKPLVLDGTCEIRSVGTSIRRSGAAESRRKRPLPVATSRPGGSASPRLVAVIPHEHAASRRVAEKIGMQPERTTTLDGGHPVVVYASGTA